jgi:hypothetical protein
MAPLGVAVLDWSTGTHHTAVMTNVELAPEIDHFYSQVVDESNRLTAAADGRLELLRTGRACMPDGSWQTVTEWSWSTP